MLTLDHLGIGKVNISPFGILDYCYPFGKNVMGLDNPFASHLWMPLLKLCDKPKSPSGQTKSKVQSKG